MDWFLINTHLIPSFLCFFSGGVMLVLAPILYQIRKKKLFILNPIKAIQEYSRFEKKILIIGILLIGVGFISLIVIAEKYGYYYFDNGVPTLLKK